MQPSQRLTHLRQSLGLSTRELALEFGVSHSTLSRWESGDIPVTVSALKILEIYEESLDVELALQRTDDIIRNVTSSWSERLLTSFASGARKEDRSRIQREMEQKLSTFLKHELSSSSVKRKLQVKVLERFVNTAAKSKGLPMKFLQVMTFLNPGMHPEAREALEKIYELQYMMAPTMVAKIIYEEFGAAPTKLFAEWSPKPFATASIGQVHLAKLKSGEKVAVKVQYPDIQKSIQSDLKGVSFFTELAALFSPHSKNISREMIRSILEETDYKKECESLATFCELFKNDPDIIIPKVHEKYCSSRVITMDFIEGESLQTFKKAPEAARKKAVETIARFNTITNFKLGFMNTDTHAGNFIFLPDGKVGFVDFGRVFKHNGPELDKLLRAVIKKEYSPELDELVTMIFKIKPGKEVPSEALWTFLLDQQAHLRVEDFKFDRRFIAEAMKMGQKFPHMRNIEMTVEEAWCLAITGGVWNVFADLDVSANFGKLSLEALDAWA